MKELLKDKKNIIILLLFVVVFILIALVIYAFSTNNDSKNLYSVIPKSNDNYVFLGDSITDEYPLEEFYDELPVVNSGESGNQTTDLLEELKERVYQYNPTKVFLLIGTNDLERDRSTEDIVKNITEIVKEINRNRPDAKIYLESIFPVNRTNEEPVNMNMVGRRNNDDIQKINNELEKLCETSKQCEYLNIYDELIDNKGNLATKYTRDGLHLSTLGYIKVTREILEYLH